MEARKKISKKPNTYDSSTKLSKLGPKSSNDSLPLVSSTTSLNTQRRRMSLMNSGNFGDSNLPSQENIHSSSTRRHSVGLLSLMQSQQEILTNNKGRSHQKETDTSSHKSSSKNKFRRISVIKNSNNDLSFSNILSIEGKCATIKAYEDEMYAKLKLRFPDVELPRVTTPVFNSKCDLYNKRAGDDLKMTSFSYSNFDSISTDNSDDLTEEFLSKRINPRKMSLPFVNDSRENKINKQIENAMKILDYLEKETSSKNNQKSKKSNSTNDLLKILNDYKDWHLKWTLLLDNINN